MTQHKYLTVLSQTRIQLSQEQYEKHSTLNNKEILMKLYLCEPHLHKCNKNFNRFSCRAHYNNLLSSTNYFKLYRHAIKAQKDGHTANSTLLPGGVTPPLFHSDFFSEALRGLSSSPPHTHISTFACQMSRLEKAELSWPFKELWDNFLCFRELRHIHTHTH